jgi:F420-0:gamma-glutamyl ligase-like protein
VHNRQPMRSGKSLTWILRAVGAFAALAPALGCGIEIDNRPAQWSYIYPAIIEPSCATASCHSDFTRRAGVNLGDTDEAYYQMVARHFVATCAVPAGGAADPTCLARIAGDSEVVHLMRADGASRMPPDFALPEADIQLIEAWISNNAPPD